MLLSRVTAVTTRPTQALVGAAQCPHRAPHDTLCSWCGQLNRLRRKLPRRKSNGGRRAEVSVVTYKAAAISRVLLAAILWSYLGTLESAPLGNL